MSGRSAYVRKEKTKVKDGAPVGFPGGESDSHSSNEFPHGALDLRSRQLSHDNIMRHGSVSRAGVSPEVEGLPYARVRKTQIPHIDVTGIEKSNLRSMLDKKSEGFRKGIGKGIVSAFGKKKKHMEGEEPRPPTPAMARPESHELEATEHIPRPSGWSRHQDHAGESRRAGPPHTTLPPIPPTPPLKRWMGSASSPQPWNELKRDTELWDSNGDTLVFFSHETEQKSRPQPSFRVSSHLLEATRSPFFITILREGATDGNHFYMPESPIRSPSGPYVTPAHPGRRLHVTPPSSDSSSAGSRSHISYEIYFPAPMNQSKTEILRHQVTTRNVFAVLCNASLVGFNLYQALTDLHVRLESYLQPGIDTAACIVNYLAGISIDDVRNQPATAAALLAWCESPSVRWEEGWKEAYVHCAGMYNRLERVPEFKFVTPVTKALLERGSLDMQLRIRNCENRLLDFDFDDMWAPSTTQTSPARASFGRLQKFLSQYYQSFIRPWPPASTEDDIWMTKDLVQRLQTDFGALYDYLVNRDVVWDGSEERSGRKWNVVNNADKSFNADTPDVPFTDIIVSFDNQNRYPHIPHPYPLVPESIPPQPARESPSKVTKKSIRLADTKLAERKVSLAYTEATNIYVLGSDFVGNDLVEAFIGFEKSDRLNEVDPYVARRGRWVLVYGILQTLASISVDTPNMRYSHNVPYHLSPRLHGTPPWKGPDHNLPEASHSSSYCWKVRTTWKVQPPVVVGRRLTNPSKRSSAADSDAHSVGSHTLTNYSLKTRRNQRLTRDSEATVHSGGGFSPGVKTVEEWPSRTGEESERDERGREQRHEELEIRDFDDDDEYDF